jgi:hypothetical protein
MTQGFRLSNDRLVSTTYANDVIGAHAGVFWLKGLLGPPDFYTSALQPCFARVEKGGEIIDTSTIDNAASTGTKGQVRSFAAAQENGGVLAEGVILLAFWVQPGAPETSTSPGAGDHQPRDGSC